MLDVSVGPVRPSLEYPRLLAQKVLNIQDFGPIFKTFLGFIQKLKLPFQMPSRWHLTAVTSRHFIDLYPCVTTLKFLVNSILAIWDTLLFSHMCLVLAPTMPQHTCKQCDVIVLYSISFKLGVVLDYCFIVLLRSAWLPRGHQGAGGVAMHS